MQPASGTRGGRTNHRAFWKEIAMQVGRCSIGITVAVVVLASAAPASAQIHQRIPEDIVPPFYSFLAEGFTPHTQEWAVVVFYRPPECVPTDFNLLDFLDLSSRPFSCALHIEGRLNWRSLDDPYPAEIFLRGTGTVPVWFVRWPELEAAVADGELTIGELAALPSLLIGTASFFNESIRNSIVEQRGGNEAVVASGTLRDGRWFQVEFTEKFRDGVHIFPHIRIEFR
jgi:hypothetical protein